jgi:hypothetical protein
MGLDKDLAFKTITGCKNAAELKNMGKQLFTVKGKWKNKIKRGRGINVDTMSECF